MDEPGSVSLCGLDMTWMISSWWYMDIRRETDGNTGSRKGLAPVREVEVNPAKEWDKEEGEDEEGDVPKLEATSWLSR